MTYKEEYQMLSSYEEIKVAVEEDINHFWVSKDRMNAIIAAAEEVLKEKGL
jgi:hypothetical protein